MKLRVNMPPRGDAPYDILIEEGCLEQVGACAKACLPRAERAVVVTDSNVGPLYAGRVQSALAKAGLTVQTVTFPAGEASKNLSTIGKLYAAFSQAGLTRTDFAVAVGGGVCGDMAGFAAATWLRGIPFVQVPTSLLAQVDSSVGGKTGVDLPEGKNLVGAFHQPALVLIDPETLKTLPRTFFADGMGEVIKYGCIRDRALFDRLGRENCRAYLADMIQTCVDIKRRVVEEDPLNTGLRDILNFGHTLGHAIEMVQQYHGLTHGSAVGVGMVMIARVGETMGVTEAGTAERIAGLLAQYGLPSDCGEPIDQLLAATAHDKKSVGSQIRLILLRQIGDGFIQSVPRAEWPRLCEALR